MMKFRSIAFLSMMICPCFCGAAEKSSAPAPIHVSIMFDDGPSANTLRLLKVLRDENVKVNFDLIGNNVRKYPELVKAIAADGHFIQNHSLSHQHPADLDDAALEADMIGGADAIEEVTGKAPEYYWPPYIEVEPRMYKILEKHGMKMCVLTNIPRIDDWMDTVSGQQIMDNALAGISDGALILFHEWRDATVDMMPQIIEKMRERGCVFLTYDELERYLQEQGK